APKLITTQEPTASTDRSWVKAITWGRAASTYLWITGWSREGRVRNQSVDRSSIVASTYLRSTCLARGPRLSLVRFWASSVVERNQISRRTLLGLPTLPGRVGAALRGGPYATCRNWESPDR